VRNGGAVCLSGVLVDVRVSTWPSLRRLLPYPLGVSGTLDDRGRPAARAVRPWAVFWQG
jgi:hypothetical protein